MGGENEKCRRRYQKPLPLLCALGSGLPCLYQGCINVSHVRSPVQYSIVTREAICKLDPLFAFHSLESLKPSFAPYLGILRFLLLSSSNNVGRGRNPMQKGTEREREGEKKKSKQSIPEHLGDFNQTNIPDVADKYLSLYSNLRRTQTLPRNPR